MSDRPGRNDPCWCGSGKKDKRCHLAADEAAEHARIAEHNAARAEVLPPAGAPMGLPVLPPLPALTPEQEEARLFWERFENGEFEDRARMLEDALAADDPDADMLFDMIDGIRTDVVERNDRFYFRDLIERLRQRAPDAYQRDLVWYHSWLIEDAVAERRDDRLPALVAPLADYAAEQVDELFRLIDLLLFHDQVEPLIDMMTRGLPHLVVDDNILESTVQEWVTILMQLHLFRHLDAGGAADVTDPDLRAALEPLPPFVDERLQAMLNGLSGTAERSWSRDDFIRGERTPATAAPPDDDLFDVDDGEAEAEELDEDEVDAEDAEEGDPVERAFIVNLSDMLFAWGGWMRRERGVPFARMAVARETLLNYLLRLPGKAGRRAQLLPDRGTVDHQLAALCSFLSGQYYRAGTMFALLPLYIEYLELHGLADERPARKAQHGILTLRDNIHRVIAEATSDPVLLDAIMHAGARA
jgi:hypothetical protein